MSHASGPDARAVDRWIRRELAAHPPRARSLIVTLWGDALAPHGGEVWLSTLFVLLAPFGLNERLVRTSVFRLARDGWLAAETRGRRSRYRLTSDGAHRFAQAYRRVYAPPVARWDGRWDVIVVPADALAASERRTLRDDLAWNGYATIAPNVHARPAARGEARVEIGPTTRVLRFVARDLPASGQQSLAARAEDAWSLGTVAAAYRAFLARFAAVAAAFDARSALSPLQAFVVRTLLVHEYRRVRLHDPQLPGALLRPDWPGARAYALCRDFYRAAAPLAETHLASVVALEGEALKPALPEFYTRFTEAR